MGLLLSSFVAALARCKSFGSRSRMQREGSSKDTKPTPTHTATLKLPNNNNYYYYYYYNESLVHGKRVAMLEAGDSIQLSMPFQDSIDVSATTVDRQFKLSGGARASQRRWEEQVADGIPGADAARSTMVVLKTYLKLVHQFKRENIHVRAIGACIYGVLPDAKIRAGLRKLAEEGSLDAGPLNAAYRNLENAAVDLQKSAARKQRRNTLETKLKAELEQMRTGYRALVLAAEAGDVERIRQLLAEEDSADCNTRMEEEMQTPLHVAVAAGQVGALEAMLESGAADLSLRNSTGKTVLHVACEAGNTDVMKLLVSRGSSLYARDVDGNTPLHLAARCCASGGGGDGGGGGGGGSRSMLMAFAELSVAVKLPLGVVNAQGQTCLDILPRASRRVLRPKSNLGGGVR